MSVDARRGETNFDNCATLDAVVLDENKKRADDFIRQLFFWLHSCIYFIKICANIYNNYILFYKRAWI